MIKKEQSSEGTKLFNEWKERLGLHDWRIKFYDNVKPEDMDMKNADGVSKYYEDLKIAKIQIVDPKYREEELFPFDFEETLVHELLHCKLALIDETGDEENLQSRVVHQLIDDLAKALVAAKRSGIKT